MDRLLALVLAVWAGRQARAQDPPTPSLGYTLTEQLDKVITFGDASASKTKADVRFPTAAAPATGWPVVIVAHDLGGSRKAVADSCKRYARRGFLTVAYDLRGQGDAATLSPASGSTYVGREERLDFVEVVAWVVTTYGTNAPLRADKTRVGVAGTGQGAQLAWAAAAWSGRLMPVAARGASTFPQVQAICTTGQSAQHESLFVPDGNTFETSLLQMLWYPSGVVWDATFLSTLQTAIDTEAFATVAGFFANDIWRQDRLALSNCTVPVCATVGWCSPWNVVQATLDSLAALRAATPRCIQLDAGIGPGCTQNDRQVRFLELREERWLERFLKNRPNGIEVEARIQTSLPDPTGVENPTALLWNRCYDAWPPPGGGTARYWLRSGKQLAAAAPSGAETPDPIGSNVSTGFTIKEFIRQAQLAPAATSAKIPRSSASWDGPVLTSDLELAGSARVELEITTTATSVFAHCVLIDVPPGGGERLVTSGRVAVRNAATAPSKITVHLSPVQMRFPAGHSLRLRVENLPLLQTSVVDELAVAPLFTSYSLSVEHNATQQSFLELPTRTGVMPALSSYGDYAMPYQAPVNVRYRIDAPQALAGSYFAALWCLSGTSLVTPLPGSDPARMTPDPFTVALTDPATPIAFWYGVLPPTGSGYPELRLPVLAPLPPITAGKRVSALAVVLWGNYLLATNPVDILMR